MTHSHLPLLYGYLRRLRPCKHIHGFKLLDLFFKSEFEVDNDYQYSFQNSFRPMRNSIFADFLIEKNVENTPSAT